MSITRRDFLKTTGALAAAHALPTGLARATGPEATPVILRAHGLNQQIYSQGNSTRVWGFNGSTPGPLLRFKQGERVRISVENALPQQTTVHWHGVRTPNAMDGVPQVTQIPIPTGGAYDYEFTIPDAGTYWYHPHQSSFEQVPRGLLGAFIVDEDKPVQVDRDVTWVMSDLKLSADRQQVEDFGRIRDFGGSGRVGNTVLINGKPVAEDIRLDVRSGERIRLRLLNCASARMFHLEFPGHAPRVISYDGQPCPPHDIPQGRLVLGPGMRADLILDCMGKPGEFHAVVDRWQEGRRMALLTYTDEKPLRAKPLASPIALPPNPLPEPDLKKANKHFIVFQGGVATGPVIGVIDGKPSGIVDLMTDYGLTWTMNFTAQHEHALMHQPLLYLGLNEHVLLRMINDTEFEHPMHLHGHSFRVIAVNDRPSPLKEWRDTVMMPPNSSVDVAFVADNPGEWMFHCHILDHAAGGMMGTVAVGL